MREEAEERGIEIRLQSDREELKLKMAAEAGEGTLRFNRTGRN